MSTKLEKKKSKEAMKLIKAKEKETRKFAKKTIEEYKNFAVKGNVIDLAIGVVIGSAFTNIVNTLVSSTITPIISLLTNDVDLSTLFITLKGGHFDTLEQAKAANAITLNYGSLLNAILNFLIISIVLFIVFRYIKKIKNKTEKNEEEITKITTKDCPYCLSKIPLKAVRCSHCTSKLDIDETIQ